MDKIKGQCHCGENEYFVSQAPEFQFVCYCNGCRTLNGGGHLCGIFLDMAGFKGAKQTQSYTYPGGSGSEIELHFCSNCSTQLYAFPKEYPGKVVVRANTLPEFEFQPGSNLFPESAFPWDKIS